MFPHYAEPVARAATPAIAALLAAQVPHELLQCQHDPRNESFGEEAARELAQVEGVKPEQVFKTLVIALPKGLAVAVIPVPDVPVDVALPADVPLDDPPVDPKTNVVD